MPQDDAKPKTDGRSSREAQGEGRPPPAGAMPAAGPHADPALTNPDATPGTGALQPVGADEDPNMQSTG